MDEERWIPFINTKNSPNMETVSAMLEAERIAKSTYVYISYQIVK